MFIKKGFQFYLKPLIHDDNHDDDHVHCFYNYYLDYLKSMIQLNDVFPSLSYFEHHLQL